MAQAKRSTKNNSKASSAKRSSSSRSTASRGTATSARSTAATRRSSTTAASRAKTQRRPSPATQTAASIPMEQPIGGIDTQDYAKTSLDARTRNDVTGIVIGIVGFVLLLSVLTPTTGILTRGISQALHLALGAGAFLLPCGLILWAISFFYKPKKLDPRRLAAGLCLIAVAAISLIGITTQGAAVDPSMLFTSSVLMERGGYVGNAIAWLLISMTGEIVGIVILIGVIIAGIAIIGFSISHLLDQAGMHLRERREFSRIQRQERLAQQARDREAYAQHFDNYDNAVNYQADDMAGYTPTALFDPNRAASSRSNSSRQSYTMDQQMLDSIPTSVLRRSGSYAPESFDTNEDMSNNPTIRTFGCGNIPQAAGHEDLYDGGESVTSSHAHTEYDAPLDAFPGVSNDPQDQSVVPTKQEVPQSQVRRSVSVQTQAADERPWWDDGKPSSDTYDDDPYYSDIYDDGITRDNPNIPVPGVIPGAPTVPTSVSSNDATVVLPTVNPVPTTTKSVSEFSRKDAQQDMTDSDALPWNDIPEQKSATKPERKSTKDNIVEVSSSSVSSPSTPIAAQTSAVPVGIITPASAPQASAEDDESTVPFSLPSPSILERTANGLSRSPSELQEIREMGERLEKTLAEFKVPATVVDWVDGPTCTTYEVQPGEGVRVSRFTQIEEDISRSLARESVRIYSPVHGTRYVGIEVPNTTRQVVRFGDILPSVTGGPLDIAVGLDADGKPVHVDLATLPHLLIAGTTGSGKSVMVNTIICSMLMRDTPDDVRLILVDPKQVELSGYNGIPHLIMPVVSDPRQAAAALQWGVTEMDRRYRVFKSVGVRKLSSYNKAVEESSDNEQREFPLQHLPAIVIIIDELTDLMMVAKKDVEASIVRIAQLGRAAGIHLVMATQRPSANVVTGLIKANVDNRMGLKVATGIDSKVVLDQTGAEKLLGNGDMLFLQTKWGDKPRRIQGCYISDAEIANIVDHLKTQTGPTGDAGMAPIGGSSQLTLDSDLQDSEVSPHHDEPNDDDPLAVRAAQLVVENQLGSTSMIQRRLKLGYARAGRVMDMLEEMGVVGPARSSKPREVLVHDLDELGTLLGQKFDEGGA